MKPVLFSFLFLFMVPPLFAQDFSFSEALFDAYETYKEQAIEHRRFKQEDIDPLILELQSRPEFDVKQAGLSVEERPVYLIRIGSGDKKILFWSQMHGDESTATMALFDLFNFFKDEHQGDSFAEVRKKMLEELSLYFIPMLNPDGAEQFTRRNALGIDVNRDALRLTSPEARILKSVRDSLSPGFGFNLHDQSMYYTPGRSPEPATLSFLAPAYDFEQSENEVRTDAMRLITYLNGMLQQHIPGKVAKYSDEHEPRAFGDMIQKWGTSTILIESGGYPDDPQKQEIRKLNFVTLLTAAESIADNSYADIPADDYKQIPENSSFLTDLIIRETVMEKEGKEYLVDIGIRHYQRTGKDGSDLYFTSSVQDLGDLSTQYGYEELPAEGMKIYPGNVYPTRFDTIDEIRQLQFNRLHREGYTDVIVRNVPDIPFVRDIPLNIHSGAGTVYANEIRLGAMPNFVIKHNGSVKYVVVNGFVHDVENSGELSNGNSLVIH